MLNRVVQSVQESSVAFSKYITANDVGAAGAHQAGFHIHKEAWPLFFWQGSFETNSRFIYYGVRTRVN